MTGAPGKTKELHEELGAEIHLSVITTILAHSSVLKAEHLCFGQQEHPQMTDAILKITSVKISNKICVSSCFTNATVQSVTKPKTKQ